MSQYTIAIFFHAKESNLSDLNILLDKIGLGPELREVDVILKIKLLLYKEIRKRFYESEWMQEPSDENILEFACRGYWLTLYNNIQMATLYVPVKWFVFITNISERVLIRKYASELGQLLGADRIWWIPDSGGGSSSKFLAMVEEEAPFFSITEKMNMNDLDIRPADYVISNGFEEAFESNMVLEEVVPKIE